MEDLKKLSDAELERAIVEKYGEDWDLDSLRKQRPVDKLLVEFAERRFRNIKSLFAHDFYPIRPEGDDDQ